MATAGRLHPATYGRTARRLRRFGYIRGESPAERALLTSLAMDRVLAGTPASEAAGPATRALATGLLAEQTADSATFYDALYVLTVTDRLDLAARLCDEALVDARERGSQFGFALASCFRAHVAYRRGAIRAVEADARASIAAAREARWRFADYALAFLVDALIELGRLDDAAAELRRGGQDGAIPHTFMYDRLLWSRARLRLAQRRVQAALADLNDLAWRERQWRARCPAALPYRSTHALALTRTGACAEARRLAREELELARHFGAPRAIGIAARALGLAEPNERGIDLLREAVRVLEVSPGRLEFARALVDLGAALRRSNHRAEARPMLERGLELAEQCGATNVAEHGRVELRAIGVRPKAAVGSGIDGLTAAERRVCELAADGLSNPEIAQALFVTRKTVETHLGRAYRKLDICGRGKLREALAAAG